MALDFLYRRTPGHPLHPPLTDATIGTSAFAADGMRVLNLVEEPASRATSPIPQPEAEAREN